MRDRADSARGARERAELAVGAVARGVFRVNHKRPNRIVARLDGRLERVELGRNALVGVLVAERRARVVVAHPPALLHDADQARRGFCVIGSEHALDCRDFRLEGRRVDGIIDVERAEQSPLDVVVAARLAVSARLAHEGGIVACFPPCRRRARAVLASVSNRYSNLQLNRRKSFTISGRVNFPSFFLFSYVARDTPRYSATSVFVIPARRCSASRLRNI